MLVEDVMTTDIATCDATASVQAAAEVMLDRGVGSVVVVRDGAPFGILTETDALHAGVATNRPFEEIPVEAACSRPLVTITGEKTIRAAVSRMADNGIKKLVVVEDLECRGIVTRSDVAANYSEFVREAHELEATRARWEARKADIDEF
jgi:CBS domain-containing protein